VNTGFVASKTHEGSQETIGISNIATHEAAHDALSHVDSATDIMRPGAGDTNWLFNPNLSFSPAEAKKLQERYNKSGEVDKTAKPPQPPKKDVPIAQ
jgi:hypothetical protein